jgi:hypothetical protein
VRHRSASPSRLQYLPAFFGAHTSVMRDLPASKRNFSSTTAPSAAAALNCSKNNANAGDFAGIRPPMRAALFADII